MKTSAVLNKAADYLEVNGWHSLTQGTCLDGPRPTCASNAIYYVTEKVSALFVPAQEALAAHLGSTGWDMYETIWNWNDAPERAAHEVIEVLRACALIEAAREDQDAAEATYADNLAAVSA